MRAKAGLTQGPPNDHPHGLAILHEQNFHAAVILRSTIHNGV
jgi:hypothetical protein